MSGPYRTKDARIRCTQSWYSKSYAHRERIPDLRGRNSKRLVEEAHERHPQFEKRFFGGAPERPSLQRKGLVLGRSLLVHEAMPAASPTRSNNSCKASGMRYSLPLTHPGLTFNR